jgi:hypothetical protein
VTLGVPIRARVHKPKEGIEDWERDLENKSEASLRQRTEAEFPRWKTSSQEWDALGGFGEVWKHRSIGGMCEEEPKSVLAW